MVGAGGYEFDDAQAAQGLRSQVAELEAKLVESERLRGCENRQTSEAITAKRVAEEERDRALQKVAVLEKELREERG